MTNKNFSVIGSGHHAHVVLDCLEHHCTSNLISIFDENPERAGVVIWNQYTIMPCSDIRSETFIHVAVGHNHSREMLAQKYCSVVENLLTLIHPTASLSKRSTVHPGSFLAAHATVGPNSTIGYGCIINHNAVVDHDCIVEDWCHIAPGAVLGGAVKIGRGTLIGAGAVVLKGIEIEENVIVGAGAVVTKNVQKNSTVLGVPARERLSHGNF